VDFAAALLKATVVLNLVAAACIVLLEGDTAVFVYLALDLEYAVLVLSLSLDLVALDLELLESHGALPAVVFDIEPAPDRALLHLTGFLLGDLRHDAVDVQARAEAAVPPG